MSSTMGTILWFPFPHGIPILVVPMSLWDLQPCGAHVLMGATTLWFPHPCETHPHSTHILMPMSLWNPSASECSKPNPDCLRQERLRAKMSLREVALQTEDAVPPAPCCQPSKALLGARAAKGLEGGGRRGGLCMSLSFSPGQCLSHSGSV